MEKNDKKGETKFSEAKTKAIKTAEDELGKVVNSYITFAYTHGIRFTAKEKSDIRDSLSKLYDAGKSDGAIMQDVHPAKAVVRKS